MRICNLIDLGWNHFFQSQLSLSELETQLPFRVISVQRNLIECIGFDAEQRLSHVQLSTYYWRNEPPEAHPTVGDWLMLNTDQLPERMLERKTFIQRRAAGNSATVQLIAANIDTLFITSTCNQEFNINRIERYLSIAAETGIHCVLIMTKIDLCSDPDHYRDQVVQHLPALPLEMVDATDAESVAMLKHWIRRGETIALVGSSGVGKSTLTNTLKGSEEQSTAAIRESDAKGRHTTTSRSLHALPDGGLLLDTPGMRELQLVDSEAGVNATFADINRLAEQCRFKDCQHQSEPGCAVLEAVSQGRLEPRRLANYQKLIAEQHRNSETLAERRQSDRAWGKFYKQALASSNRFKSRD